MAEYIERETALILLDGIYDCNDMVFEKNDSCVGLDCGSCQWRDTKNYIRNRLSRIPAADVVPVVRCGECEYSKEARVNKNGFLICPASGMEITDHDYCSYGERMDMVTDSNQVKDGDGDA